MILLALLLGAANPLAAQGQRAPLTEAEFKAATLSKIIPYVTWPRSKDPLVVGLVGKDPFKGKLHQLLRAQPTVQGRRIELRIVKSQQQLLQCHVVFVPKTNMRQWQGWTGGAIVRGQLTIGEDRSFVADRGGVCSLSFATRKLEINRDNSRKADLKISSKLLRIATIVKN